MHSRIILSLIVIASLTQCVCTTRNAKPMSLDKALEEVALAIRSADARAQGQKKTGLMASDVVVTLNVENVAKDEGGVNLSVVPATGATIGGGWTGSVTSAQGNTITITYKNLLFAGTDTVVDAKPAKETLEMVDTISSGLGGNIRKTQPVQGAAASGSGGTTGTGAVNDGIGGILRDVNQR